MVCPAWKMLETNIWFRLGSFQCLHCPGGQQLLSSSRKGPQVTEAVARARPPEGATRPVQFRGVRRAGQPVTCWSTLISCVTARQASGFWLRGSEKGAEEDGGPCVVLRSGQQLLPSSAGRPRSPRPVRLGQWPGQHGAWPFAWWCAPAMEPGALCSLNVAGPVSTGTSFRLTSSRSRGGSRSPWLRAAWGGRRQLRPSHPACAPCGDHGHTWLHCVSGPRGGLPCHSHVGGS